MTILVCPLNWGLGHASRCIPIIQKLIDENNDVIIATDGYPLQLLRNKFPQLKFIDFPSYDIKYSKGKSQVWAMLCSVPRILWRIYKEHQELKKIVSAHNVETIISDNRFGLWHNEIHSIYITHQLMVKMPRLLQFMERPIWRLHRFFINKYDECWIPDDEELKLSGDLAHKYPLPNNAKFIGILSRFSTVEASSYLPKYHTAVIISGPEPQRSIFEQEMKEKLLLTDGDCILVQGLPDSKIKEQKINNLRIVSHLADAEMKQLLLETPNIICRSGYTSLMDLAYLGRKATLIPTPGQTEQEYLANYESNKQLNN